MIEANNRKINRKAFVIAIANSSQYGNNARVAPAASVCDGLLHVNIMKKVPAYRLDFVYSFFNGTVDKSNLCELIETDRLTVSVNHPVAFHIDGEPCGKAEKIIIELLPASLNMLVPQKTLRP